MFDVRGRKSARTLPAVCRIALPVYLAVNLDITVDDVREVQNDEIAWAVCRSNTSPDRKERTRSCSRAVGARWCPLPAYQPTCCFSPTFFDTHPPFRDVPLMQYEVLISFPCDSSKTLVLVVAFSSEAHKKLARRLLYHNTITQHFRLASSPLHRRSSSILAYVH